MNKPLLFVNAFELPLALTAAAILLVHLIRNLGVAGLISRGFDAVLMRVQDGPHDFCMATVTILVGYIIRTLARMIYGNAAPAAMIVLGAAIMCAGIVCLIRIIAPPERFKLYWIGAVTASLVFATIEVML